MIAIVHAKRVVVQVAVVMAMAAACARAEVVSLEVKAQRPRTFYVESAAGRNQIAITSESTLEDFTVVCNEVAGQWEFNPRDVEHISGKFSIKVEDLRTGIDLRDHHLRGPDWLDAAKHPAITIVVKQADAARRVAPNTASLTLVGTCSMHGVTRDLRIPCTLTYLDESPKTMERVKGDLIRMRAEFSIKLSDYAVKGPPGSDTIGLKVSNTLPIKVSVFGSTEKPPARLKIDKPDATTLPAGVPPPESPSSQPAAIPNVDPPVLQPPTRPAS